MTIINVIEHVNGMFKGIDSFPIMEEQLSEDIVSNAEELFINYAIDNGFVSTEEDENSDSFLTTADIIEDGYWSSKDGYEVFLTWSEVHL